MAVNLASPGILVREVDLTIGNVDPTSGSIGALVAPFTKGPVEEPQLIENEEDLLQTFGQPYSIDNHYEYWMVASSYLSYGGTMQVIRANDAGLKNATEDGAPELLIKSDTHYNQLGYDDNTITGTVIAAKTPGSYANGIRVSIIDGKADQIITTTGISTVGMGVTQSVANRVVAGAAGTSLLDGYLKGIVTGIPETGKVEVKVLSHVSAAGTVTNVDYQANGVYCFKANEILSASLAGTNVSAATTSVVSTQIDWFEQQEIVLTTKDGNGNPIKLEWDQLAEAPGTSSYAQARGARHDELHVVVVDDKGTITGNAGTILEKHLNLSKAKDAEYSVGSTSYWRKYLASVSQYIYGGSSPAGITTTGYDGVTATAIGTLDSDNAWDQDADSADKGFGVIGVFTSSLTGGKNYGGKTDYVTTGALDSGVDDILGGYELFANTEEVEVDFIMMGAAHHTKELSQAVAEKCIAVAEARKDAVAFISPFRQAFLNDTSVGTVTVNNIDTMTNKVVEFFAPITSTTYGVFDSGYKYMFDRFNNTFRYVPLNGDIAGCCARTDIEQFPWFSPAGTARGTILNSVKLAYNPGKKQRDILYSNRVNPVMLQPGAGIVLFGDKTGFGKRSAFDRINVRRLFIFLEDAISAAAKDQLFEFNDELTRTNFVNIIEPFLREVQSNRGIFDFVVICDETNNTAAVIDRNEFVADIFIKPARSINFIGLTFVATRTGVDFEEVIGSV